MGSPLYMAPEQMASSRDVDARADVWSLGATLYEVARGSPPFETDNVLELAMMIREVEPADLSLARPDLPPSLCAVVARCLRKDPAQRFPDAAALGAALGEVFVATSASVAASRPLTDRVPSPATDRDGLEETQHAAARAPRPTPSPRGAAVTPPGSTVPSASFGARAARWPLIVGLLSLTIVAAALTLRARQRDDPEARPLPAAALASAAPTSSPSATPSPPTVTAPPPVEPPASPSAAPPAAPSHPVVTAPARPPPPAPGKPGSSSAAHGAPTPPSIPAPPPRL